MTLAARSSTEVVSRRCTKAALVELLLAHRVPHAPVRDLKEVINGLAPLPRSEIALKNANTSSLRQIHLSC
jgi:hypothetical protein